MVAWGPELTIDALQADLAAFRSSHTRRPSSTDSESSGDSWVLVGGEDAAPQPPQGWDLVAAKLESCRARTAQIRFEMCMASFHAIVAAEGVIGEESASYISPLEYCEETGGRFEGPSQASTLVEYRAMFGDFPEIFCASISTLVEDHLVATSLDPSSAQDEKDIGRDTVCVQGKTMAGSVEGYGKICTQLGLHVNAPVADRAEIARLALSLASRTFSGGAAFDLVMSVFGNEHVLILPLSSDAEPLDLVVVAGELLIRAHTKYALRSVDEEALFHIDAFTMISLDVTTSKSKGFVFLKLGK